MNELLTPERIGLDRFSPSSLQAYEDCPRLFYYQNWLGLKLEEDKLHMDFGNAIHGALESVYLEYDDNFGGGWQAGSFDNVADRFKQEWKKSMVPQASFDKWKSTREGKDNPLINTPEKLWQMFFDDGMVMLKSYWEEKESLLVNCGLDLVDFERYMKQILFNPLNPEEKLPIPASYRIDAQTRKHDKIVDFKTSKSKYDEKETRKKIQGQLYLLGNWCETGEFVREFDYVVLRKGLKSDDRVQIVHLTYDEADMAALFYRIQAILMRIANREFDRPTMGHPQFCQCFKYEEALAI
jgi:hypothetical protein